MIIVAKTQNEPSHVLIGHSVWPVDLLEKNRTKRKSIKRGHNANLCVASSEKGHCSLIYLSVSCICMSRRLFWRHHNSSWNMWKQPINGLITFTMIGKFRVFVCENLEFKMSDHVNAINAIISTTKLQWVMYEMSWSSPNCLRLLRTPLSNVERMHLDQLLKWTISIIWFRL